MVNPQEFTLDDAINYSTTQEPRSKKFKEYGASVFSIPKILLDTTGAIPTEEWPLNGTVLQMIDKLKKTVYNFDGDTHEPPIVEIIWGSNHYNARLLSMNTKFLLFDTNGDPIRAEINLKFTLYETQKKIKAEANKLSPNLTHIVEVKAGDTLPNLCYKIYNNPSYYMQVARINQLSNFRRLKNGIRLVFPPLAD